MRNDAHQYTEMKQVAVNNLRVFEQSTFGSLTEVQEQEKAY